MAVIARREKSAWVRVAIGGGAGMLVAMGLGRFSYTAMVPALIGSGALTAAEAGWVGAVNLAGFLTGAALAERLRRLCRLEVGLSVAIVLCAIGLAGSALPWGFAWLALCRGVIGLATAFIMVQSVATAVEAAPERSRPAAAGFVFAGVGLGILLTGILVPRLLAQGLMAAWAGIAAVALVATLVGLWGWRGAGGAGLAAGADPGTAATLAAQPPPTGALGPSLPLALLALAHFLFSFGIVPHTLYWVDFLARGLGYGVHVGGWHWSVVGIFAFLGPWLSTLLARRVGIGLALPLAYACVALGVGIPALGALAPALWFSTVVFGAQPGVASLMAARARDFAAPGAMARVMRVMILSNGLGATSAGLVVPWLFERGGHASIFALGGAGLVVGAVLCLVLLGQARRQAP
ncbi:MAG: YbfB/YjiJ family MFS transporter [Hyphomicrobiaceae bacterium]|nr:YbfB/YjiJ family MFS transporter [Hyphomicrobiaceae bacterium]